MAYNYQPLDFEDIFSSSTRGGGGSSYSSGRGFTGSGNIGFKASPADAYVGYEPDAGTYTPIDFESVTNVGGRGGFQLPYQAPVQFQGVQAPAPVNIPQYIPSARTADAYTGVGFTFPKLAPVSFAAPPTGGVPPPATTPSPGVFGRAMEGVESVGKYLESNPMLAKLLGAGLTGGVGALMSGRAQRAAGGLESQLGKLGQTQRAEGQRLIEAAQRGELTAPQMQQLEAFRAQQAQGLAARGLTGGTAEQQLNAQVENMRQQFLQQNLQTGLSLLGIGDQYTQQAITAGYNASQNAQNLSSRFYELAARQLGLLPSTQQQQPQAQPQQPQPQQPVQV